MRDDLPGADLYDEPLLTDEQEQDAWEREWREHERWMEGYYEARMAARERTGEKCLANR